MAIGTQKRGHSKASKWPSITDIGRVGTEYSTVHVPQPRLLIWIRHQSADNDKRERLGNTFRRIHANLEASTQQALASVLGQFGKKVVDRFEAAGTVAVQVSELWHDAELAIPFNHVMKPCWLRMVEAGLHFEADWCGAVKPQLYVPTFQQRETPSIEVGLSPFLQKQLTAWLKARTEGVWSQVSNTIHKRIETTLKNGLRDGLTLQQMTDQLKTTMGNVKDYQAKRIARTETTGGMNAGGHLERTELGIQHKEWVSTLDRRTRGAKAKDRFDHISSNGEIVGNADCFVVSGQKLLYPADGSNGASAGNICNCRCCSVGAWPSQPLKPKSSIIVPEVKPPGWDAPKYDTLEDKPIPMPDRPVPAPTASLAEHAQYNQLRAMDAEQRSSSTVAKINHVRRQLAANNDVLETIRQRFVKEVDDEQQLFTAREDARKRLEDAQAGRLGKKSKKEIEDLKTACNKTRDDLRNWKDDKWTRAVAKIATPSKANVVVSGTDKLDSKIIKEAQVAAKKLSQVLSTEHGATANIGVGDCVVERNSKRAFYSPGTGKYFAAADDWYDTHLHEMGHWIEENGNRKVEELCKGFLHHRGGLEKAAHIPRQDAAEVGIADEFGKAFGSSKMYCGKYYQTGTELLSMGLQKLATNPVDFAVSDPEFFKFIVGIIRGDLL